jgi:hypothetical protein
MSMTKKEKEFIDKFITELMIQAAFRWTDAVTYDIQPPTLDDSDRLRKGFLFNAHYLIVDKACTSSIFHSSRGDEKTTTQNPHPLYSTRLLALKAMRHEVEKACAMKLLKIDVQIEAERGKA